MSDSRNTSTSLLNASPVVAWEGVRVFGGAYFSFYFSYFCQSLPAGQDVV